MYIVQTVARFLNQGQLHLFAGGLMPYLRYLCFFAYSGIQHILCCVVCCARVRLLFCAPNVTVHCLFLIVPSVFSNVYFLLFDMGDVPW